MALNEIYFAVLLVCLALTITPATLFHIQPRVSVFFPVRGRWLPVFLWTFSVVSFLSLLVLLAITPFHRS